ncbi:flagella basal body P-ring formation protein FlgA [Rhodobium orientis]|uniref:Flagella basal body P-ring formation protein FlgA n=1 Tax=Rhodobium orientis TaxID=34017 RepID=A0A327JEX9_9HYPH|nr:flagellar basal body P-ring formation chaperone FlgA [Rhodobium orientis]MBB4301822.1 flagella basal body P-ring formation protein FlgA [Rhodobium orientis]MBK5948404.1 flagella basal body P-ring formation protein FlgA [Rhodobium orientis]RAI24655.1 flagella basal body P-ring formation protein FlgA [Rhodobium orientis]
MIATITMMLRLTFVAALLLTAAAVLTAPAHAGEPRLKAHVAVTDPIVTVGDFFDNAGALAAEPLFRAPDLGEVGTVPAGQVVDAARSVGLHVISAGGLAEVTVARTALTLTRDDLVKVIADTIAERARIASRDALNVTLANTPDDIPASPTSIEPLRLVSLNWSRNTGRFTADFVIDQDERRKRIRLNGSAQEMIAVAVLARSYDRDEIVSRNDILVEKVPAGQTNARYVVDPEKIAGLAARRNLPARRPLAASDFAPPMLVRRGETVTIIYEAPGLLLTARGQAMESGAENDMVNVSNTQSRRIVRTRVISRGKVSVTTAQPKIIKLSEAQQ